MIKSICINSGITFYSKEILMTGKETFSTNANARFKGRLLLNEMQAASLLLDPHTRTQAC